MVPAEFATMLEMTLYKLVGNNLVPKTFVNSDFWRKLRTKFTNAGQYAKISSKKVSKIKSKPLKDFKKTPPKSSEPGPSATPTSQTPAAPVPSPKLKVKKGTSSQGGPLYSGKGKGQGKGRSKQSLYLIPRDRPSSEDFVVEQSPRSKRVAATTKSFYYYLRRHGVTEAMLGNKQ